MAAADSPAIPMRWLAERRSNCVKKKRSDEVEVAPVG
jgi:hypothetical protein